MCTIIYSTHHMLPFTVNFKPGIPVYEQVVYAVKKAIVSEQMKPGDKFPSVRQMSQDLKINPNTAQKIVAALVHEGMLEVNPGIGTVVSQRPSAPKEQRQELLKTEIEHLVVEAKKLSLDIQDIENALRQQWKRLSKE